MTRVGDYAFQDCDYLTSITIPNSVSFIGEFAFSQCQGLTELSIPSTVTSIEDYTFELCTSLTSFYIPNSVTKIGDCAFFACTGLTSLSIPGSVKSIGKEAFSECLDLSSINIPNSVTSIGENAFACTKLAEVKIPSSVTSIGKGVFRACSSLISILVEDGNSVYDSRNNCNAIIETASNTLVSGCQTTIIPTSVTSIGEGAFAGHEGLVSITIPNSVTSIESEAFFFCSGLTSVSIPPSVKSIGASAFCQCLVLTSVTIPNSVTSISESTFQSCPVLTSVTIPNSVTSIGKHAFRGCSGLTSVTIGNSVTSIGNGAFYGCDFATVESLIEEPFQIYYDVFSSNTYDNATLYVPKGTIDKYKSAGWRFLLIEERSDGSSTPSTQQCAKPTISYKYGKLTFNCGTPEATCQYSISDTDIKSGSGNEVELSITYTISAYATKPGYHNSETATATLCWIDAEPKTEGITNGVASVRANAVLIQSNGHIVNVQGAAEGSAIHVYNTAGRLVGSALAAAGSTDISTSLSSGEVGIVKIGDKAMKVVIK